MKLYISATKDIRKDSDIARFNDSWQNTELELDRLPHLVASASFCAQLKDTSKQRSRANFSGSNMIALDFEKQEDGPPAMTVEAALVDAFFQQHALGLYTTKRHTPEAPRFRVLFRLPEIITDAGEYEALMRRLQSMYTGLVDVRAKDAARLWLPSPRGEWYTLSLENVLDIQAVPELPELPPAMKEGKRNDTLYGFAMDELQAGTLENAKRAVLGENALRFRLPEREALATFESARKRLEAEGRLHAARTRDMAAKIAERTYKVGDFLRLELERPPELVQDVIRQVHMVGMVGAAGAGKSAAVSELSSKVMLGSGSWLGHPVVASGSVLTIYTEMDKYTIHDRLRLQLSGSAITPEVEGSRIIHLPPQLKAWEAELEQILAAGGYRMLVVDSWYLAASGNENAAGEQRDIMTMLRDATNRYELATIVVHHTNKAAAQRWFSKGNIRGIALEEFLEGVIEIHNGTELQESPDYTGKRIWAITKGRTGKDSDAKPQQGYVDGMLHIVHEGEWEKPEYGVAVEVDFNALFAGKHTMTRPEMYAAMRRQGVRTDQAAASKVTRALKAGTITEAGETSAAKGQRRLALYRLA